MGTQALILVLFFISGASGLIYEVLWFRVLTVVVQDYSTYSFAAMLGTFLAGLAAGSWLWGGLLRWTRRPVLLSGWNTYSSPERWPSGSWGFFPWARPWWPEHLFQPRSSTGETPRGSRRVPLDSRERSRPLGRRATPVAHSGWNTYSSPNDE